MDDDFEELTCEDELLQGSSQESLTVAAANISFDGQAEDDSVYNASQTLDDYTPNRLSLPPASKKETQSSIILPGDAPYLRSSPNSDVIDKIENVFEQMSDAMLNEKKEISITLKTRQRASAHDQRIDEDRMKCLSFPGKNEDEAWRFAVVVRILELMHEALRIDVVMSKRDIYYRDPALFGNQSHVDRYVDDIALTFGVSRTSLNVTAVAKGLFAGAISFCRRDGSTFTAAGHPDGILVPALKDILCVDMTAVRWILVIEKEATFRSVASSFWDHISTEGVIITGKGYPDLATRAMLHFLSAASPSNGFASPPVYGFADCDPDGVAILMTYKHGSKALAHENNGHCVPQLQWLGLHSEHLLLHSNELQAAQGIMMLTPRDRRKAITMMEQQDSLEHGVDGQWASQLRRMLMLNSKAELQLLDAVPGGMLALLDDMLSKVHNLEKSRMEKFA